MSCHTKMRFILSFTVSSVQSRLGIVFRLSKYEAMDAYRFVKPGRLWLLAWR